MTRIDNSVLDTVTGIGKAEVNPAPATPSSILLTSHENHNPARRSGGARLLRHLQPIAYTSTDHKADNSIEAWIAAWGNARGWANGGSGGSANR